MKNLVKRYVAAMIRDAKTEEGLTEENFKVCDNYMFIDVLVRYYKTMKHIFKLPGCSGSI